MITPNILYYARLEFDATSKKTPKYVVTAQAGYYPPIETITGRNGKVSMYLMEKLKENANVPSIRLQAKNGLTYGYPLADKTYSAKNKVNPFFEYKDDGFLFIVHQDDKAVTETEKIRPSFIELIVLDGAKVLISSYCKQLVMGGFNEVLDALRKQAK